MTDDDDDVNISQLFKDGYHFCQGIQGIPCTRLDLSGDLGGKLDRSICCCETDSHQCIFSKLTISPIFIPADTVGRTGILLISCPRLYRQIGRGSHLVHRRDAAYFLSVLRTNPNKQSS